MQVRKKDDGKIYAMKVLRKDTIVARKQVAHTKAEKNVSFTSCIILLFFQHNYKTNLQIIKAEIQWKWHVQKISTWQSADIDEDPTSLHRELELCLPDQG